MQCVPLVLLTHAAKNGTLEAFLTMHPLYRSGRDGGTRMRVTELIVILRLPVFVMGVAAGLLTLRGVEYPQSLGQSPSQCYSR